MDNCHRSEIPLKTILHIAPINDCEISGLTYAIPSVVNALHQSGVVTGMLTTASSGRYEKPESYPVVYLRDVPLHAAIASMPPPLNQPDLIIFHSTYIINHALLAYEAYRRKIPYVICPHSGMTRGAQQVKRLKKMVGNALFFNWMVQNAVALHCLTQEEAFDVKAWNRPIFIVGNGVDVPPTEVIAYPGQKAELKFIFLGRLDIHHKGLDWLLEACAMIQADLRNAKVRLCLYGPDVKGSLAIIIKLIETYQIQDLVDLKDPVQGEGKQAAFQSADLFIHTSRFEGHPIGVLEALSYGVPCLLTPGTNMATEVVAAGAGSAVESNPKAIADGILKILAGRSELPTRGQAARNLIERKYSWDRIAQQLLKEYTNLLPSSLELV